MQIFEKSSTIKAPDFGAACDADGDRNMILGNLKMKK